MNLLMATELSKDASFDVYFYVERATKLPDELRVVACGSLDAALKMAGDAELDFFVTDVTVQYQRMKHLVKQYESNNLNVIVRLGLIPSSKILNLLSESTSIKSVIAVEQTVFDILRDHPVSKKMHVVQNSIPLQMYKQHYPKDISSDCVEITYLGSLVPQKGFGLLAKIWKQILEQHPFAVLNVIGTGQVYGLGDKMGKWGIAEETFESELRKHLMDSDGNPHRSVIFHGILGSNKAKVIENSTVGIANPSGATETFCLSAVELQAGGLPVIAGARYGLNDTVIDGQTGFLVKGEERLKKKLLYLLSNPDVAFNMKRAAKIMCFTVMTAAK
uniref:Glycosyl transferase family 1 domain-containing protein n=1 Tax=uncultured organism MedDCM-OCT-S12-C71 TaxID=743666 RepID=D6PLN2_9ZZZZ|nr:hypothetical protein [uncultured organism MedDCM-OCT-S12-C71]